MTRQHQSALSRLGFRDPDKEDPKHGLACEYLQQKMRPYVAEEVSRLYKNFAYNALFEVDGKPSFIKYDTKVVTDQDPYGAVKEEKTLKVALPFIRAFQNGMRERIKSDIIDEGGELSSMIVGPQSGAKGFLDVSFRGELSDYYACPPTIPAVANDVYSEELIGRIELSERRRTIFDLTEWRKKPINQFKFCFWGEVRIQPTAPELLLQQIEFYANNLGHSDMIWVLADFDLSDFKRMASTQFPQLKCFQLGEKFEEWCENRARPEIPEL